MGASRRSYDPLSLISEVDRLATSSPWPNFDPRRIPVLLFTGDETFLVRHPSAPPEFVVLPDHPHVAVAPGRHPLVRANSCVHVGVLTATIQLDQTERHSRTDLAALLIHEGFHVFQRLHHPNWQANELDLFVYPIADPDVLALRRLEASALRSALALPGSSSLWRWLRAALSMRRARHERLSAEAIAWERGMELNEGLAQYVERRAAAVADTGDAVVPAEPFAVGAIRLERYAIGEALAILLDRTLPGWKERLERDDARSLDELSAEAVTGHGVKIARFPAAELASVIEVARADVGHLDEQRRAQREAFVARPGWRIVITNEGREPLWPQGFDPLNIQRVSTAEVLHSRFLKLGNSECEIDVLERPCLTESAGDHPLFQGVRTLLVTGFRERPIIERARNQLILRGEGFNATLTHATPIIRDDTLLVRLNGAEIDDDDRGRASTSQ